MPEWVQTSLMNGAATSPWIPAYRVALALALGLAVAGLYRWAKRGEAVTSSFVTTLILLSTVIAMATQVIGDNVARAFSLVGALSVVRFRTVVKDTQDTAFVIFAVVVGMAAGANHLYVALVGIGVVAAASVLLWPSGSADLWHATESVLSLRIDAGPNVQAQTDARLAATTRQATLISVSTAKSGASLDVSYRLRLLPGVSPAALVAELNAIEGVRNVELTREEG